MKIEKVNENQIRCILTAADLDERQLKLTELAYGNTKAKQLFQDMMTQAHEEFGFTAEDIPLMVEAIPMSPDSLVLYITKVSGLDEFEGKLKINIPIAEPLGPRALDTPEERERSSSLLGNVNIFAFASLDNVIRAAKMLKDIYTGCNTLYKDNDTGDFYLVIANNPDEETSFAKVCFMLNEYGVQNASSGPTLAFLEEHCVSMIDNCALQTLADL